MRSSGAHSSPGLPYFNPHSFRTTLVQLGQTLCRDAEQFKAWSQNLGHEGVLTTFLSYGAVAPRRQGQIIQTLTMADAQPRGEAEAVTQAVLQAMRGAGLLGGQGWRMHLATGHHRESLVNARGQPKERQVSAGEQPLFCAV